METQYAFIVLADISGYTKFVKMHRFSLIHAEQIISDLLETVVQQSRSPLVLNEIEGDAACFHAMSDGSPEMARQVYSQVADFFEAFRTMLASKVKCNLCMCEACGKAGALKLKVILHHGEVAIRKVQNIESPAGETVILAHRLLKNSLKSNEYILLTDEFFQLCGDLAEGDFQKSVEKCEGLGKVKVWWNSPGQTDGPSKVKRTVGATIRQIIKVDVYTLKKLVGLGSKAKFKSLEGV